MDEVARLGSNSQSVNRPESWFTAGEVALVTGVLMLFQCTCVPEASNLRLLCSSVSVTKKNCPDGVHLTTLG